jgi:hypothetical protein
VHTAATLGSSARSSTVVKLGDFLPASLTDSSSSTSHAITGSSVRGDSSTPTTAAAAAAATDVPLSTHADTVRVGTVEKGSTGTALAAKGAIAKVIELFK